MTRLLIIAAGGATGAVLRYTVGGLLQRLGSGSFPVGTMGVNLIGCLLIGFCAGLFASPYLIREEYKLFVMVGVLGAFTTFSTFGLETFSLINGREYAFAALNVVLSNVLGLAAVWLGYRISQSWFGA